MAIDYSQYKVPQKTSGGIDYTKYKITPQTPVVNPDSFLKGAAGVSNALFGSGAVGEVIGTQAAKGTFGKTVQSALTGREMSPEESSLVSKGPSAQRVAGSVVRSAALFTPLGKIAGAATPVLGRTAAQAVAGGIAGYASDVGRNLEEEEVGVKAAMPGLGTILGVGIPVTAGAIRGAGNLIKGGGEKIITGTVRPSKVDIEDGFKLDNLVKYKIKGSLQKMLDKAQSELGSRSKALEKVVQGSPETIDLNGIVNKTAESLNSNSLRGFGSNKQLQTALMNLKEEVGMVAPNGQMNLADSQKIKQAAGYFGAWKWNLPDPESKASERVYNAFYNVLKKELAVRGGPEVTRLNGEMSEIIPIANALIRRIPVAARNQALSLSDMVTLTGATFNPSSALLTLINIAQRSASAGGRIRDVGRFLGQAGVNTSPSAEALGRGAINLINQPRFPSKRDTP